tara:strand:+ start:167 stop:1480 length:1314 start_codon:yes stop_codon:yes gene_type:complete
MKTLKNIKLSREKQKEKILILDTGTFCDFKLMDTLVLNLRKKFQLVYITDHKHFLHSEDIKINYSIPKFLLDELSEIMSSMTTSTFSKLKWISFNPMKSLRAISYIVNPIINDTILTYKPKLMIAHSSQLIQLILGFRVSSYFNIPTYIIHFAPGLIPNDQFPLSTCNLYKDPNYNNYLSKNKLSNIISFKSIMSELNIKTSKIYFQRVTHINCFSDPYINEPTYGFNNLKIETIGPFLPLIEKRDLPSSLKSWMKQIPRDSRLLFFTLGSFSNVLIKLLPNILKEFISYCEKYQYFLIFQDDFSKNDYSQKSPQLYLSRDFISYPSIVPLCDLVIFTGSLCLQNICFNYLKPMLFIPYLIEQFLWGRVYKKYTKIPFYDFQQPDKYNLSNLINKAINVDKNMLMTIKNSLNTNPSQDLLKIISKSSKKSVKKSLWS